MTLATEPIGSTPPIPKPAIGHDSGPIPSIPVFKPCLHHIHACILSNTSLQTHTEHNFHTQIPPCSSVNSFMPNTKGILQAFTLDDLNHDHINL